MPSILEDIKIEECEECSNQNILYDAIFDGKARRLCKKCIAATGAIEIKKPKNIDIQTNKRPSVKQILMKMSGLDKEKEKKELPNLKVGLGSSKSSTDEITLNDLIERRIQMKKEGKTEGEKERETKGEKEREKETEETKTEEEKIEETKTAESAVNAKDKPQYAIKQLDPSDPLDFNIKTTKNISIGDLVKLKKQKENQEKPNESQEEKREERKKTEQERQVKEQVEEHIKEQVEGQSEKL